MSTTLTIRPAEAAAVDCYISNGANANTAFDSGALIVGSVFALGNTIYNRALLRFDLSDIPDGAIPTAATLTLTHGGGAPVNPSTYTCYRLTQTAWSELGTWNRYDGATLWSAAGGDYTATDADSYTYTGGGALVFDGLLAMVGEARSEGLAHLDVLIVGPEALWSSNFVSGLSSADGTAGSRPKLEVVYDLAVHLQCAQAVQTAIRSLDLPDVLAANVKVRKFPHFRKDTDTLPLVLVTTHLPVTTSPATNLRDDINYPVTISLFDQSDANQTLNQGRMLVWRERIRKHFHQSRLSGVDSVWMCNIPQSQPFSEAWFIGGMKDMSPLTLNFISRESRS